MKVMNVGNTSYSNSRQQNFGMNLNFAKDAIEMIGAEGFEKLSKEAVKLKSQATLRGSVLSHERREILLKSPEYGINRVVISDNPAGENTFSTLSPTLHGKLDFAIWLINKIWL